MLPPTVSMPSHWSTRGHKGVAELFADGVEDTLHGEDSRYHGQWKYVRSAIVHGLDQGTRREQRQARTGGIEGGERAHAVDQGVGSKVLAQKRSPSGHDLEAYRRPTAAGTGFAEYV